MEGFEKNVLNVYRGWNMGLLLLDVRFRGPGESSNH